MAKRDHISTIGNTDHLIPRETIDAVMAAGAEAMVAFVVAVAEATQQPGLTVEQRNLLARSVLADVSGALLPCARMIECSDEAIAVLPALLREVMP